jgi:hypothetical protein
MAHRMNRIRLTHVLCGLVAAWVFAFLWSKSGLAGDENSKLPGVEAIHAPFPDFGFLPPPQQYKGKLFRQRQDYPTKEPGADKRPAFLDIPFNENADGKDNWKKYLIAVRDYCFHGNLEADWVLQDNSKRAWYHAPWQHWGPKGREGIHGLTREATSQPKQLAPTQTTKFQTYAVGFYNEFGGYTIGRVWLRHYEPDPSMARFPVGTIGLRLFCNSES